MTTTYLVTYMVPMTIPVEVGGGEASARATADRLMAQIVGTTVRMHVLDAPIIVEAEIGEADGEPTVMADES